MNDTVKQAVAVVARFFLLGCIEILYTLLEEQSHLVLLPILCGDTLAKIAFCTWPLPTIISPLVAHVSHQALGVICTKTTSGDCPSILLRCSII